MFSCTGYPGYPDGQIMWRIKHENETAFRNFDFYSQYSNISDDNCRRKEINNVPFQFDMSWNNTLVRCYIETTDYYAEGQIRLLPCKYKTNRPQLFKKSIHATCNTFSNIKQGLYSKHILRKTIEGYLDSVPSLTSKTIKTLLIMHAFHSSRHLQSKWMLYFSHASMV